MKRLILFNALLMCNVFFIYVFGVEIGLGQDPPRPRVGEEYTTSSTLKKSIYKSTAEVYYPVSAYVDEIALTVSFTQSVGMATVMVYDANNQLVDMVSVDTTTETMVTLSTEAWATGAYKLVINYGNTSLVGNFNF